MRTDEQVRRDVEAELHWDPEIDDTDVAVKTTNGVVTLVGFVSTYPQKYHAAFVAKRVTGVTALANDIEVRLSPGEGVPDPQLAQDAVAALKVELPMSWDKIKPTVQNHRISLEGTVEWYYQRERAERAMHDLRGVVSVRNSIRIKPTAVASGLKEKIVAAFRRNAQLDADSISIEEHGGEITLRGRVRSWAEREQAVAAAWSAPGVTHVNNEIIMISKKITPMP
jgi:osmotically-inducible protein OsmY